MGNVLSLTGRAERFFRNSQAGLIIGDTAQGTNPANAVIVPAYKESSGSDVWWDAFNAGRSF